MPPSQLPEGRHIPQELDGLVMRSLAKDPDDRFQSAEEMRGLVQYALQMLHEQGANTGTWGTGPVTMALPHGRGGAAATTAMPVGGSGGQQQYGAHASTSQFQQPMVPALNPDDGSAFPGGNNGGYDGYDGYDDRGGGGSRWKAWLFAVLAIIAVAGGVAYAVNTVGKGGNKPETTQSTPGGQPSQSSTPNPTTATQTQDNPRPTTTTRPRRAAPGRRASARRPAPPRRTRRAVRPRRRRRRRRSRRRPRAPSRRLPRHRSPRTRAVVARAVPAVAAAAPTRRNDAGRSACRDARSGFPAGECTVMNRCSMCGWTGVEDLPADELRNRAEELRFGGGRFDDLRRSGEPDRSGPLVAGIEMVGPVRRHTAVAGPVVAENGMHSQQHPALGHDAAGEREERRRAPAGGHAASPPWRGSDQRLSACSRAT